MTQVQIDQALFLEICKYFLTEDGADDAAAELIKAGLYEKIDKIVARTLYKKILRAPTDDERDAARLEYLCHKSATSESPSR